MRGDTFEALLEAYTERGHLLLALEKERDAARRWAAAWKFAARSRFSSMDMERIRRDAVEHLRRGIEAYREERTVPKRVVTEQRFRQRLADATDAVMAWEREEGKR